MKQLEIIIISLLFLVSCKTGTSKKTDTSVSSKDSINIEKTVKKEPLKKDTIKPFKMPKNCGDTTFDIFFERFGKDSIFQKKRVKYPLKWLYYEGLEDSKLIVEMTNYKSYRFFNFIEDKNAFKKEYGAFEVVKLKERDTIIYQRRGLDNGLAIDFKFKKIDDCWFLVEILDKST
ncbi:MAG: DUF4348 domain-containing protein [Flavobacteriaceae bacterium]|nr:MAG: DUF4348 domain-containing protein [Flavobacteriaceae bacterium]